MVYIYFDFVKNISVTSHCDDIRQDGTNTEGQTLILNRLDET